MRHLPECSVRPARTTLALHSPLLWLLSARRCTPWPGLRGGEGGVGFALFFLYVLAYHLKLNRKCFQRAGKALNPMTDHVCGSHVSIANEICSAGGCVELCSWIPGDRFLVSL